MQTEISVAWSLGDESPPETRVTTAEDGGTEVHVVPADDLVDVFAMWAPVVIPLIIVGVVLAALTNRRRWEG